MKNLFFVLLCLAGNYFSYSQKQISVDDFTIRNTFAQRSVTGINWMKDGKYYSAIDNNKIIKYDVTAGQPVETIVDGAALSPAIQITSYTFSDDERKILLLTDLQSIYRRSYTAEYFVYDLTTKNVTKLSSGGKQSYATFSPSGGSVGFVRANNLFTVNLSDNKETQITTDGKFNSIINGTTDWVYEEEFGFVNGFYSISLDGKKKIRLTQAAGSHNVNMSDDFQFYIDYHSSAVQSLMVSLYRTKGNTMLKVLEKNESLARTTEEYGLSAKEFFTFNTVDGTQLNGFMLKPKNFDPAKQYPLLIYQYSGPGSQNAGNAWGGSHFYFHQSLVQKGYVVAVIDTLGTGARGEAFKKMTYKQLGKYELEDLIAGGKYLAALDYIDDTRLGIWGWSYGGYMSSLAMTKGGGLFKVGIAVAPVTNWRFYDTIYTERYLQTPQLNAHGYDDNSPLSYANNLKGKFLLIHGTGDDNVHFQNSVVFQEALINAGKQFESFYYPDKTHRILGGKTQQHLYSMMAEFVLGNL